MSQSDNGRNGAAHTYTEQQQSFRPEHVLVSSSRNHVGRWLRMALGGRPPRKRQRRSQRLPVYAWQMWQSKENRKRVEFWEKCETIQLVAITVATVFVCVSVVAFIVWAGFLLHGVT